MKNVITIIDHGRKSINRGDALTVCDLIDRQHKAKRRESSWIVKGPPSESILSSDVRRDGKDNWLATIGRRIPPGFTLGENNPCPADANLQSKVLLFRNIMRSDSRPPSSIHQGSWFLSSALTKAYISVVLCDAKILSDNVNGRFIDGREHLDALLEQHPDINIVAFTLCEDYFYHARQLAKYIRRKTHAFIVVGGVMPTLAPEAVFLHLPEANFVVRGEGEKVLRNIALILKGQNIRNQLSKRQLLGLQQLQGVLFANKNLLISADRGQVNFLERFNQYGLDFSLLRKVDIESGLDLYTSRGCNNGCSFCTTIGRGNFRAMTVEKMISMVNRYKKHLVSLYGNQTYIPARCWGLSFYDDDFLANRARAREFFKYILHTPFYIEFFQASINSFFMTKGKNRIIDRALLDSLDYKLFYPRSDREEGSVRESNDRYHIYLGTENFCSRELQELVKGYTFSEIECVVKRLSEKKIRQAHHFIFANINTRLHDIYDNLIKISRLKRLYGDYFNILMPVTPRLVSFFNTASYMKASRRKQLQNIEVRGRLSDRKAPAYNYDLVKGDVPRDNDVAELLEHINTETIRLSHWQGALSRISFLLLYKMEALGLKKNESSRRISKLDSALCAYYRYEKESEKNSKRRNDRYSAQAAVHNIQLMLTRRCFLRCIYCPVIQKNIDMPEDILRKSINLLFTSDNHTLRLDFTGGEPLKRFDLIKKGVLYAKKLEQQYLGKKNVSFYIVTNGLALSPEVVRFLSQFKTKLEISFDGDESTHNKYKLSGERDIVNPYRQAARNLQYVLGSSLDYTGVMVVLPENVSLLAHNFSHLVDLGFRNIEVNYALGKYWDDGSRRKFFHQFIKIKEKYRTLLMKRELILGNIRGRREPAILNAEFMVDVDGCIHLLSEFQFKHSLATGNPPFRFGNVSGLTTIQNLRKDTFMSYYTLYRMYSRKNMRIKRILHNNIIMGFECKKFFSNFL